MGQSRKDVMKILQLKGTEDPTGNWKILGRIDSTVFLISAILTLCFVFWGALDSRSLGKMSTAILTYLLGQWGWMYLAGVLFFVLFCLFLAVSKYGNIKLGSPEDVPEYSNFSWFAMLFGCGMGVGLVF